MSRRHKRFGGPGDAQAVHATVIARGNDQLAVSLDDRQAVRLGQLAVAAAGLVGRVTAVDESTATIELITAATFFSSGYTDISNVTGILRGTSGKLMFEHVAPGAEINEGNRVVVADPAQRDDKIGAVTIGRATTTKAPDADAVEVTPTVDVNHLQELSIMTPYVGEGE